MFTDYRRLLEKVDAHAARLARLHAPHLVCAPGCDACCRQWLSPAPVELFHIADWLSGQPPQDREALRRHLMTRHHATPGGPCPLLHDGRCRVYPVRPLVCRSHGLILDLAPADAPPDLVRSCDLNYTATDPDALGRAGAINQPLLSALMFQVDGLFARAQKTHRHGERWPLVRLLDIEGW